MNENKTVSELKEFSKRWSMHTLLTVINEELHNAKDLETKVEILTFKSSVLEKRASGYNTCIYCEPKIVSSCR